MTYCSTCGTVLSGGDKVDGRCRLCTRDAARLLDWADVNAYQVGGLLLFFEGKRFAGVTVDLEASQSSRSGDAQPPVSVCDWAAQRITRRRAAA